MGPEKSNILIWLNSQQILKLCPIYYTDITNFLLRNGATEVYKWILKKLEIAHCRTNNTEFTDSPNNRIMKIVWQKEFQNWKILYIKMFSKFPFKIKQEQNLIANRRIGEIKYKL